MLNSTINFMVNVKEKILVVKLINSLKFSMINKIYRDLVFQSKKD